MRVKSLMAPSHCLHFTRKKMLPRLAHISVLLLAALLLPSSLYGETLATVRLDVPDKFRKGVFSHERTLKALPGLKVSVYAAGVPGARFMAIRDDGVIFLSSPSEGNVLALPDRDGDGVADEVVIFARNLKRPHGLAFRDGTLVVAETGSIIALEETKGNLKADVKRILSQDVPAGGGHWTRTVVVGPDGALYLSAGSSCNACLEADRRRAAVLRFTDSKAEIFATGLRNSVGIEFHPETGELWGVDNGRDRLGDDVPPEELNLIKEGGDYGWPFCYGERVPDPELGSPERCRDTVPPVARMQAHSAPLGIAFGHGLDYPKGLSEALFIAFHGSWDREIPTGYKLVSIPFRNGRPSGPPFDVVTGWLVRGEAWGRPVDAVVGKDGALYLSDDRAGAVYRITYTGKP